LIPANCATAGVVPLVSTGGSCPGASRCPCSSSAASAARAASFRRISRKACCRELRQN